jgi:hypothetical protein
MVELDQAHGARYTVSRGPPHPQTDPYVHCNYHQDIFSPFALDIDTTIAEFDQKTWGFLVYPDD